MKSKLKVIFFTSLVFFAACSAKRAEIFEDLVADHAWQEVEAGALILDVRSAEEFNAGHIHGALNIPHDQLENRLREIKKPKNHPIVVYCRSGRRAGIAEEILRRHGFSTVTNGGGYRDMKDAELKAFQSRN